jgi:hypothetical protein
MTSRGNNVIFLILTNKYAGQKIIFFSKDINIIHFYTVTICITIIRRLRVHDVENRKRKVFIVCKQLNRLQTIFYSVPNSGCVSLILLKKVHTGKIGTVN